MVRFEFDPPTLECTPDYNVFVGPPRYVIPYANLQTFFTLAGPNEYKNVEDDNRDGSLGELVLSNAVVCDDDFCLMGRE